MIKEYARDFWKRFCGYYFLKGICDDIKRDISNLFGDVYTIDNGRRVTRLSQLADTCKKVDLNNEEAIKFILHHLDVSEDIFQRYKYFELSKAPWYIQELLLYKYDIQTILDIETNRADLYYKGKFIGAKNSSHIGELLDNIEKVDNELSNK